MVRSKVFVVLLLACLVALPGALSAQTTADVVGRVTDTSGAVLPGASVTLENTATKDVRTTVTSDTGDYLFTLLPIGPYTVRIELSGFQSQNAKVTLTSGDRIRVDGRLAVGSLQETVLVTGESPLLQTDQSTLSSLVTEQAVQDLPVNGRNFMRLVQLVPGATEGGANSLNSGTRPDDRRQTSSVSINGAPDNMNNQMIDGMDNNERAIGTVGVKPSMDAIAEVRVQTNLYLAETGRTGGGIINILTKSGTNAFHGSAYEFRRDSKFDERNYFEKSDPVLDQNQFGGSFGGPIVSNRTFFFGDYEQLRNERGQVNNLTLPTAKMRTGDFSELLNLPTPIQIYDAANGRVPFQGNIIPKERLEPIALDYLSMLPANTNGDLTNNYQATTIGNQVSHTMDGRVDHRFNTNNSMFARYSYNNLDYLTPGGCPTVTTGKYAGISPVCRGDETGGFPGPNKTTAHAFQANYVRVFSSTLIGEFKGGYVKTDLASLPTNYQTYASDLIGIKNANLPDEANGQGLSTLTLTGYTPLGDAGNVPLISHGRTPQFAASLTKTMGAHSFKAGGGVILREFGVIQSQTPLGTYTFNQNLTRNAAGNAGGDAIASLLLGYPSSIARNHSPYKPQFHSNEPSFYVQDDWRTNDWLTLNIGLRYDVFTPFNDENGKLSNMDWTLPQPVVWVAGENGVSDTANVKTDYSNVAPRFGFAATLPRSIVLRGGWGLTYFPGNVASGYYMKNPPLFDSYAPTSAANDVGVFAPTLFLKDGMPAFNYNARPDVSPSKLSGNFRPVSVNFKSTRIQQFNLQMEKDFFGNVVTVGYVGSRGDLVAASPNINLAPIGPGAIPPRRAFTSVLNQNVNSIAAGANDEENLYDAFQVIVQRRFSGGLSLNAHARWSNAETYSLTPWSTTEFEWQQGGQDVEHAYVFQANYSLPFGADMTGFKGGLVKGWQVNAVANWQGGTPVNISNQTERANTGGGDRPDVVPGQDPVLPKDQRTVDKYFNTNAWAPQAQFTVGNAPRTFMHGPPQRRLDLAVFKQVDLGGPHSLQLRYELYNVTNTSNFQNPSGARGNNAFGRISSTGNAIPRQMQFAVKYLF